MRQSGNQTQLGPDGVRVGTTLNQMLAEGRSYSGRERNCCFLNTGGDPRSGGRFANISAASGLDSINDGRAIGLVDWDQDGDVDLWTSNRNAPRLRLMRNDLINQGESDPTVRNHFVSIRLVGNATTTNRDAIGARVEIVTAETTDSDRPIRTVQTLRAGEGFLSQSSKWLQFGLGKVDRIEKVVVNWPGSTTEEFSLPHVDRRYALVQGTGNAKEISLGDRQLELNPSVPDKLESSNRARIRLQVLLPAPELVYKKFNGRSSVKHTGSGRPVLVNLWSASCRPCLEELGELTKRADEIRAAGIDVLAVSVDSLTGGDEKACENLIAKTKFPFESGLATQSMVEGFQDLYDHLMPLHYPLPVPTSLLIDENGRLSVIYKGVLSVDDLIADKDHSQGSPIERFQRSAALDGRLIENDRVVAAIIRQEAAARDLFAKKLELGGFVDEAMAEYGEVLKLRPDYPHGQYFIGRTLTDQNQISAAREHYKHAIEHLPDEVDLHSLLADVYIRERNLPQAEKHFAEAVRINPDSPEFRVNLGNILVRQNNLDQAAAEYQKAIDLNPKLPECHVSLGNVLMQQGKLDEAKAKFKDALRIKPDYAQANHNLGAIYLNDNNLAMAKAYFESALRTQPSYAQAHYNLGRTYLRENNRSQAKYHLEQAVRFQPNHTQAKGLLARLTAQGRSGGL